MEECDIIPQAMSVAKHLNCVIQEGADPSFAKAYVRQSLPCEFYAGPQKWWQIFAGKNPILSALGDPFHGIFLRLEHK